MANRNTDIGASMLVGKLVKEGKIPPARKCKCEHCGKQAMDYHHEDYDKPFEVIPLCRKCHVAVHHMWWEKGLAKPKYGTDAYHRWREQQKQNDGT